MFGDEIVTVRYFISKTNVCVISNVTEIKNNVRIAKLIKNFVSLQMFLEKTIVK